MMLDQFIIPLIHVMGTCFVYFWWIDCISEKHFGQKQAYEIRGLRVGHIKLAM
jgi:hypothetical protein